MSSSRSSRKFAASHQRSWLWGHHAVIETLRAGRWQVVELLADPALDPPLLREIRSLAEQHGVRLQLSDAKRLQDLSHQSDHQGLLARMGEFPCENAQPLFELVRRRTQAAGDLPPLFVVCDRLQDAHNFGAILRCCDAVKADGVIIGEAAQVSITPHVARASSGAVNHLRIFRVPSLLETLRLLQTENFTTVAATEKSSVRLWDTALRGAVALVIGSEAKGIAEELLSLCSVQAAIPMMGGVSSLNAAVAAGILLYECRRQQTT